MAVLPVQAPELSLSADDVRLMTLRAQGLIGTESRRGGVPALLRRLGAVQAQDYPMALWSIAQRLSQSGAAIEAAVADGEILRTHVLRPTWHFVPRDDLRWMQELLTKTGNLTKPLELAKMIDESPRAKALELVGK